MVAHLLPHWGILAASSDDCSTANQATMYKMLWRAMNRQQLSKTWTPVFRHRLFVLPNGLCWCTDIVHGWQAGNLHGPKLTQINLRFVSIYFHEVWWNSILMLFVILQCYSPQSPGASAGMTSIVAHICSRLECLVFSEIHTLAHEHSKDPCSWRYQCSCIHLHKKPAQMVRIAATNQHVV